MIELMPIIESLDASMTSQLVATLAGLSIAAASFLSSSLSAHQNERDKLAERINNLEGEESGSKARQDFIKEEKDNFKKAKENLKHVKTIVSELHASSIAFMVCLVESLTLDHFDLALVESAAIHTPLVQSVDVLIYGVAISVGVFHLAKSVKGMQEITNA